MLALHPAPGKGLQSSERALVTLVVGDPAPIYPNWYGSQPEADRGNARWRIGRAAVFDQAVGRIGFVPKVVEGFVCDGVQQPHIVKGEKQFDLALIDCFG